MFGAASNTAAAPFLFGSTASAAPAASGGFGAANSGGLFGNQQNKPAATAFSTTPAQNGQAPAFGAVPATGGLFGQKPPTSGSSTMFGSQPSTAGQATTASFGSAASNTAPSAGGLFGSNNTQAKTGGLFGNAPSTNNGSSGGLFGNPAPANTAGASTGLFGNSASTNNAGGTGGLFGSKPAAPSTGGLFGSASAAPSSGATGGLFGSSSAAPASSSGLFGAKPGAPTTSGGLFGNSNGMAGATTSNGLFNQAAANQQQTQLTAMTRVGDLPAQFKKELEDLDKYISTQHLIATTLQSDLHKHDLLIKSIPIDVKYLHTKVSSIRQALTRDFKSLNNIKQVNDDLTEDIRNIMQLILQLLTPGSKFTSSFHLNDFFISRIKKYRDLLAKYEGVIAEGSEAISGLERSCNDPLNSIYSVVELVRSQYTLFMELAATLADIHNEVAHYA